MDSTTIHLRIAEIPVDIRERALFDPILYAAIKRYGESDDTLETFLVKLILLQSDMRKEAEARILERLKNEPPPLVIIRGAGQRKVRYGQRNMGSSKATGSGRPHC